MFIRIGKRGLNTDHIVRWYKDSQWTTFGEKHRTPNLMVEMSDHEWTFGQAYNNTGDGEGHKEWFFGATAELLWEILEGETMWRIDVDEEEFVSATEPTDSEPSILDVESAF